MFDARCAVRGRIRMALRRPRAVVPPFRIVNPASVTLSKYIGEYLASCHRLDRAHGCPIAALSGDLPNMPELAQARFTDGTERLVAGLAKLVKKLRAKNADALAWSVLAEMAGALALSRTVSDPARATHILRNSRAMVRSRLGLDPPLRHHA